MAVYLHRIMAIIRGEPPLALRPEIPPGNRTQIVAYKLDQKGVATIKLRIH